MTAAAVGRAHRRAAEEPPAKPPFSWSMAGVLASVAGAAVAAISGYATLVDRVTHLEAQIPPGSIQRLDERTLQIQDAIKRLEARP